VLVSLVICFVITDFLSIVANPAHFDLSNVLSHLMHETTMKFCFFDYSMSVVAGLSVQEV
jgi:thiamine kinase-like enzyme